MASSILRYLKSEGVQETEVLEVGGGIGAVQVELLKAGAARSVNVELSSGYEEAAKLLADEEGVSDRVERQTGDFVEVQDEVKAADIVVMNRVVCCYPWMERLLGAAVVKTGRYLALVFPREKWWVKTGLVLGNSYMALRKVAFRSFVHPVDEIEALVTSAGFEVRHTDHNFIWQAVVMERVA